MIEVKFDGQTHELNYEEELKCSEETINEDLIKQPGLFAYYIVLAELAGDASVDAKLELDMVESGLDVHHRADFVKKGKKIVEASIRGAIHLDITYVEATKKLNEEIRNAKILKGICRAFDHRKDMLIALAANMRAQLTNPELFIKKQEQRDQL